MSVPPRTPVLVGQAQVSQRCDDPADAASPLELMQRALLGAARDCGSRSLVEAADSVRVPHGLWRYANPAAWLAEKLELSRTPHTGLGPISGSTVQRMLHHGAVEIAEGKRDVVVLVSGECEHSRRRAKKAGLARGWSAASGPPVDETFGSHDPEFGALEMRYRLRPMHAFSLYENALRAHRGETPQAHQEKIARLWERMAAVAARNPDAWSREGLSAEAILAPEGGNRLVAYPYTKYLVSNMVVDMGAALVLCSAEAARRHGVPEERMVYLHAATDVLRTAPLAERAHLHDEPALGAGGRRALALAGCGPGDVAHVDLYSCFPAAVQIAADELGFDPARELTVTGGLGFSGGPFNSYVMHSLAKLVERLRETPGALGFASGIGGYMAKHAFGVYGSAPPERGFRYQDCTDAVQPLPTRPFAHDLDGPARIETFACVPAPDGGEPALLAVCLRDDGTRTAALNADPALVESVAREELCGRAVRVRGGLWEAA